MEGWEVRSWVETGSMASLAEDEGPSKDVLCAMRVADLEELEMAREKEEMDLVSIAWKDGSFSIGLEMSLSVEARVSRALLQVAVAAEAQARAKVVE